MSSLEPHPPERPQEQFRFADFTLDLDGGFLLRGGEEIPLRPKTFEVLACLVKHHGRLVTRNALIEAVWPDTAVTDNSLSHCLLEIRRALGDDSQELIRTVARRGYLFTSPVTTPVVEFSRQPIIFPIEPARLIKPRAIAPRFVFAVATLVIAAGAGYLVLRLRTQTASLARKITFAQITDQAGRETFPSLAPDGKSLVYAGHAAGNWDIYLQRVGGTNAINLTGNCSADDMHPAFSPDGERIAFHSERDGGGIFVMGATGESVRRLSNFGFNPAWSPDGKQIVFGTAMAWGPESRIAAESRLWVMNASTGQKRMLTWPAVVADAVQPTWSPHGHRIAYWAVRDGQRDIWTVSADGTHPVAVTQDTAVDWNPVWSPDGTRLYFGSNRSGSMNLWVVGIDEKSGRVPGRPEAVTMPSPYVGPFSISADGRRIAYAQMTDTVNIQTAGFDPAKGTVASQPRWITEGSRQAGYPDLSPDGEWLTFHDGGIFVVKSDGTALRQLTSHVYQDRYPRWAPDGRRIAFHSNNGGAYDIWLINADGSGLERLTWTSARVIYAPVWSPDGKQLAFAGPESALVIDVAKPWKEQLPQRVVVPPELGARFYPWSWSPDGSKLAGALLKHDGVTVVGLGAYSLESQQLERLSQIGYNPVWLADSRRLLAQDHRGKLYFIDSESGKSRQILSVAPHSLIGITLPRDNRRMYFSVRVSEADIWLASLN